MPEDISIEKSPHVGFGAEVKPVAKPERPGQEYAPAPSPEEVPTAAIQAEVLKFLDKKSTIETQAEVKEKNDTLKQIEDILSAGLEDLFASLTPNQQMQFKIKGEETARKILDLLSK